MKDICPLTADEYLRRIKFQVQEIDDLLRNVRDSRTPPTPTDSILEAGLRILANTFSKLDEDMVRDILTEISCYIGAKRNEIERVLDKEKPEPLNLQRKGTEL